jgi:hypothetical protein
MTGAKERNLRTITHAVIEETRVDFGANIYEKKPGVTRLR